MRPYLPGDLYYRYFISISQRQGPVLFFIFLEGHGHVMIYFYFRHTASRNLKVFSISF